MKEDICPDCNGSGEGMYDGTKCRKCRGRGVLETEDETEEQS